MTRRAATPAPTSPDPLADVREAFGGTDDDARGLAEAPPEPERVSLVRPPVVTQEGVEPEPVEPLDLVALGEQMVATWHEDTVALGFLHKGGRCGCHYMARTALASLVPAPEASDEPEPGTI